MKRRQAAPTAVRKDVRPANVPFAGMASGARNYGGSSRDPTALHDLAGAPGGTGARCPRRCRLGCPRHRGAARSKDRPAGWRSRRRPARPAPRRRGLVGGDARPARAAFGPAAGDTGRCRHASPGLPAATARAAGPGADPAPCQDRRRRHPTQRGQWHRLPGRLEHGDARRACEPAQVRAGRTAGAGDRRDRYRQGAGRARPARNVVAARPPLHRGQLRRPAGQPGAGRTVRP